MKNYLLYLCSLNCLFSCYAPSVIKDGVAFEATRKNIQIEPVYDTSALIVKVVHNPKYANVCGVELISKNVKQSLKIEKVRLGGSEKVYSDTCDHQPVSLVIFEHCLLSPTNSSSRFGMQIKDIHQSKCEVYYIIDQVQKVTSTNVIEIIPCRLGMNSGIVRFIQKGKEECIWSLGVHN